MADAPTPREVLARINAVLVVAGLNDTIFSIRDCNSTLFLLLFKKLFTWRLSGVIADPSSTEEHEANYAVLLNAISSDVLEIPLGHISPRALAEGELWPLHNLAEIFSELCDILLQRDPTPSSATQGRHLPSPAASRPATHTGRRPAADAPAGIRTGGARGKSPARHGAAGTSAPPAAASDPAPGWLGEPLLPGGASAAAVSVRSACAEALAAEAVRAAVCSTEEEDSPLHQQEMGGAGDGGDVAGGERESSAAADWRGTTWRARRPRASARGGGGTFRGTVTTRRASSAPPASFGRTLPHAPSSGLTQFQVSEGLARRARRDTAGGHRAQAPPRGTSRPPASAPPRGAGRRPRPAEIAISSHLAPGARRSRRRPAETAISAHLEAEIAELHAALAAEAAARPADVGAAADAAEAAAEAAARVARMSGEAMGHKGARQYTALMKQQLAGVRRAERCELVRGRAADRNALADARAAAARRSRVSDDVARHRRARLERAAAKGDLTYRRLYRQALESQRQRMLLERSVKEELWQAAETERRRRREAVEGFYAEQLHLLQLQLDEEEAEREMRERVSLRVEHKLEAEARAHGQALMRRLFQRLDHMQHIAD